MGCLSKLRRFWFPDKMAVVWLLLSLPALLFFQTTVHEGSHAINYIMEEKELPTLAPFPHNSVDPVFHPHDGGRFQAGITLGKNVSVMKGTCDDPTPTSKSKLPGFIALPQFLDLILAGILTLFFLYAPVSNPLIRFLLRTWFIGLCIDFTFNTVRGLIGLCVDAMDWSKFMLEYGIGRFWFGVLTWLLWAGLVSLILLTCRSKWLNETVAETNFWDYRWIAFICGILSSLAFVVSIVVSHPKIDKSSLAFFVPFLIQFAAIFWYWTYFRQSFKNKTPS